MSSSRIRSGVLAVVAGSAAANLYFSQPVLASLGSSLSVSASRAGTVVVATLLGNGLAQLLVVPLADMAPRRLLLQLLLGAQGAAMAVMAASSRLTLAAGASVLIGAGGAAAMVALPYASALAPAEERGRAAGSVMAGVLTGILVSRSVSGIVTSVWSWRAVYVAGAGLALAAAAALSRLPESRATGDVPRYRALLGSVTALVTRDRLVQRRMAIGALGFVSFNLLWTGLTLLLSAPPYSYPSVAIGLFGIAGVVGTIIARNAGQWFDRGHGLLVSRTGWCATGAAWIVLAFGGLGHTAGLAAVIAGVALLDAGMQAQHITNQATLMTARPSLAGRVVTAYMSGNVIAGAAGSAAATMAYPAWGWPVITAAGVACSAAAFWLIPRGRSGEGDAPATSARSAATT